MRMARDTSVAVLNAETLRRGRPLEVCDAMASLGARGLRMAAEVPGTRVTLNDGRAESAALARKNVEALGFQDRVEVVEGQLEDLLRKRAFDWVDIDPFGTPAPHLDVSVEAVRDGGIWAVTATDKAALCGVYPDVCLERYRARPLHGVLMWETSLRILVGALARTAQLHARTFQPLLCHSTNHYIRVYARITDGEPDELPLGYAWIKGFDRGIDTDPPEDAPHAGPLWATPTCDANFLKAVLADLPATVGADVRRRLETLQAEATAPPLYYTIDEFTREYKVNAPRLERFLQALRDQGHVATRTHFLPRAFKTDASPAQVARILRSNPA